MRATNRLALRALLGRASTLLAAAAVLGAAGCGTRAPAVTGLTVTVTMVGVAADELEITVTTPLGEALAPTRRPRAARGILASPQSVSIFLPDALAGQLATCTVTPYVGGQIAGGVGSGATRLVLHALAPVAIELDRQRHDDGGAGGLPDSGDGGGAGEVGSAGTAGTGGAGGAKALGQPCVGDGECDSTLCRDGVCCASTCGTLCQACNLPGKEGTCAPVPAGTAPAQAAAQQCAGQPASTCSFDGTCDGNGGCRRYPAGVACKAATCSGAAYQPPSACDGEGTCVAAKVVDCSPYNCGSTAGPPACLATCQAGGTDCVSPAVCANGSCGARTKKSNGAGCTASADCTSGVCADGVCCATTCAGACVACDQTGKEGTCAPVPGGKVDPHKMCADQGATTCGKNGLCDGAGACALYPTTTTCAAGSCKGATLHPTRHCDGKGTCATPADVDCTPFRCDPSTTACFVTCNVAALQCVMHHACANGVCE